MFCLKDYFWAQEFLARWVVVWRSCVQSRSQYQLQGNASARHIRHLGISPDERLVTRKKLGGKWDLRALLVPQTSLPPFFAFQPPGCSYLWKGMARILTRFFHLFGPHFFRLKKSCVANTFTFSRFIHAYLVLTFFRLWILVLQKLSLSQDLLIFVCTFVFSYSPTLLNPGLKEAMATMAEHPKKALNDGKKLHSCSQCDFTSNQKCSMKCVLYSLFYK